MNGNYKVLFDVSGFTSLDEARKFLGLVFTVVVSEWGSINPCGVTVVAGIEDTSVGFCDDFELKCG